MEQAIQLDLWRPQSAARASALLTSSWDGQDATLSLTVPELTLTLRSAGRDLFDALQQLRLQLEPLGWIPLCNGARTDCYPSGMARSMGGASSVYELTLGKAGRFPLVGLFEAAPPEKVGTVEEQDTFFRRWMNGPKNRGWTWRTKRV
jgi:hypothetical protein